MGRKIDYPFNSEGKEFEYYYKVYKPNANGDINIVLRLNIVNDKDTYRWTYGNIKDYDLVGAAKFFKPLKELIKELNELEFCWEWEDKPDKKKYIVGSFLIHVPVYDGNTNLVGRDEIEIQKNTNTSFIIRMRPNRNRA